MKYMVETGAPLDPYIKAQIAARQKPAVIKIEFLNFRSKYPDGLLVAVEGDDDKVVYSYWIARFASQLRYEFFVCGGKRGVRLLRNSLAQDRSGASQKIIYLVDRDFDDLAKFDSTDHVFMLDRYSIENYLAERGAIDKTIQVAFPGSGDPQTRAAICDMFDRDYSTFLKVAKDVNHRVFVARRLGLPIDDVMPDSISKLANVQLGNVSAVSLSAEQALPFPEEPLPELLETLREEFEALDPVLRHRGKFAYKFLRHWLDRLAEEFRNPTVGVFPPPSVAGKVKPDEMTLGALASRANIPVGFDTFFDSYAEATR